MNSTYTCRQTRSNCLTVSVASCLCAPVICSYFACLSICLDCFFWAFLSLPTGRLLLTSGLEHKIKTSLLIFLEFLFWSPHLTKKNHIDVTQRHTDITVFWPAGSSASQTHPVASPHLRACLCEIPLVIFLCSQAGLGA